MALILEFRSGGARSEQARDGTPGSGAQIIIFPGVRRERHAEQSKPRRRERSRPKRDRLELPD